MGGRNFYKNDLYLKTTIDKRKFYNVYINVTKRKVKNDNSSVTIKMDPIVQLFTSN